MQQKIVFMGTPEFSIPTLEALITSKHKVLTVYSQPAKKANRGQKIISSSVETYARNKSLNVRTPINLNTDNEYNFFKKIKPDIVIVVAYGNIIPKRFLNLAKNGFINLHASLLPKWRGAAPIQRSIMNLDNETGVSIMKIEEELDAGPIIHQDKIKINEKINTLNLSKVLSQIGAKSILETIDKIQSGKVKLQEQNHSQATYAKKILKSEGKILWDQTARKILAKINGMNPKPGAWFEYKTRRYKVWEAEIINESGDIGKVLNNELTIACSDKAIKILKIQKEGKEKQDTYQFLLGNKINKGEYIK